MSYDLMAFDPAAAPTDRVEFLRWYEQQTDWPAQRLPCPMPLRAWLTDMQAQFPDINTMTDEELDADEDAEISRAAEYSFGAHVVYVSFAWSAQSEAYAATRALTCKHGVGFFDVSAKDGEIVRDWQAEP